MRAGIARLERGAGTILALAIIFVTISLLVLGTTLANQTLGIQRLSSLTESIALAAADALRGLTTGYPCIVAKDMAEISGVVLERCRIVGFEVFIETSRNDLSGVLRASARAGPGR